MTTATTEGTVQPAALQVRESWGDTLRRAIGPLLFMAPATLLVIVFFFVPVLITVGLSATDLSSATGFQNWKWIGLENYRRIANNPQSGPILWNTAKYVVLTLSLFNIGMALVVALLSVHIPRRAGFFFRALWLLPRITPSVVYIMMWKYIAADAPYGILNTHLLEPLGVEPTNWIPAQPWLFVVMTNGFIGASFGMIIFTSAIESIPRDYLIAALVDGCSLLQRIRYVILPMIRWPLLFVTTYQTLSLLTSFEYILLLTDGQFNTEVWSLWAYHRALNNYWGNFQWGFGAALATVLVAVGIVLAIIYMRYFQFNELVQEPKIEAL
ncbi:sugar ABC transporter permease [Litorilinea aerophila]|uniref:Sugar ABC transporter permease n=1 Tax=Litorilinea aerophila TaxID=1204385 RepID=A0A540VGI0_9CHLR|nr:sugar ABC transporter permease [Litorilinea aerophila]MCC9076480.1 sugar ABC transporter permease [Litorilinea aerophila]GIV79611.1 MAG: sugar ABC transporter permease [Litorilinea sp.]